jgi:TnsA-like endonuclease N terminal
MAEISRSARSASRSRVRRTVLLADPDEPSDVEVGWRLEDGTECRRPWRSVSTDEHAAAMRWRAFRWYKGQKHYSGLYWSATTRAHVAYESRLELARLLYADFDPEVSGIVSQPFVLTAVVGGQRRKHVPDYLLTSDDGPVVLVKPQERLGHPKVASTLAWAQRVVESRGWRFEVVLGRHRGRVQPLSARAAGGATWSAGGGGVVGLGLEWVTVQIGSTEASTSVDNHGPNC